MSAATIANVTVSPEVQAFLKERHAEEEFKRTLELACTCYPDRLGIKVFLHEDWELASWWRVIIEVSIPTTVSLDRYEEQKNHYYDLLIERVPSSEFSDRVCQVRTWFVEG